MPTEAEILELIWNTSCSTMTTLNGVNGYCFTGPNGNSLFLPAAGYRSYDEFFYDGEGYYWSSSLDTYLPYWAIGLNYNSLGAHLEDGDRTAGWSVRAVREN
jgi:hypothetical protein